MDRVQQVAAFTLTRKDPEKAKQNPAETIFTCFIIRKLSFNPSATTTGSGGGFDKSPTNNGHGLNNRITAKYVLHKNCTPTRCKVQPREASTVFDEPPSDGWFETEAANGPGFYPLAEEENQESTTVSFRRSSSPSPRATPSIPETQNNYKLSRNTKNLPKKRTNITSNKNVNLRKCFRLRSKTFDGVAVSGGPMEEPTMESGEGVPSVVEGASVESRPRVPDSSTLASNNSSSRLIGAKLDKISKSLMRGSTGEGETGTMATIGTADHHYGAASLTNKISKPLFLTAKKCARRSNYNHIEMDAADDDDEFDDVDELEESQHRQLRGEEMILTSTMESAQSRERLEQETTLTVEEPSAAPSVLERLTVAETAAAILFEKVKYDRTKRYLIDQLTEGGEAYADGSGQGSPTTAAAFQLSSSCSSSPFHLAMAAAVASKSEDFIDPWKNYNIRGGASWDKVSKSPWDSSAKASPARCNSGAGEPSPSVTSTSNQMQPPVTAYPTRTHWNPFEYSPAHLSRLQSQSSTPQRKQPQYRPAFQVQTDVWENLNNKHYEIDTDVVWRSTRCSSRRTSASTVETWIDDETFDNSFNEELERRCTTLKICE
ncbi:AGAP007439-PA-like protein [Anopheles sinensis]|uniref:AGAP007439-PA-like protein n=1 Tax=Anopheles sinensis TaxID=74873 RepID=A0A084WN72_ANOSI|nr:AGAP007439-PA-like protein [Anopheles sinensis]